MDRQRRPRGWGLGLALRTGGAGLLVATGAVHLDLYLTGYRAIPVIGWLFLLQVIGAFALAAALVATRGWLLAAVGTGFAASTIVGYLLAVWIGLFGFKEVRTAAGLLAGAIEVAAAALLSLSAVVDLSTSPTTSSRPAPRVRVGARTGAAAVAAISLSCLAIFGISAAIAIGPPTLVATGRVELRSAHVGGAQIVTNPQGRTLYWFELDTPAASRCVGSCTSYWPPLTGTPTRGPGVTGRTGTIPRGGAVLQATYDGHPLYTYVGDAAPGETNGNGLNLSGGTWHEVRIGG